MENNQEHDALMELEEHEPSFQVDNDKAAEWCLKKIKAAKAEHDRLMALLDEEYKDLDQKCEQIENRYKSETGYLKSLLWGYFNSVEKKETKTQQSYKLLSGTLVYKKPTALIVKPDEEKLLSYLVDSGHVDLIETKQVAKWGELKKTLQLTSDGQVITEDGEILDFIQIEEKAGEFNVKD